MTKGSSVWLLREKKRRINARTVSTQAEQVLDWSAEKGCKSGMIKPNAQIVFHVHRIAFHFCLIFIFICFR